MAGEALTVVRVLLIVTGAVLLGLAVRGRQRHEGSTIQSFVVVLSVVGIAAVGDGIVALNRTGLALV
jgi:hypothetical protein